MDKVIFTQHNFDNSMGFQNGVQNKTKCHSEGSLEVRAIQHLVEIADSGRYSVVIQLMDNKNYHFTGDTVCLNAGDDYNGFLKEICRFGDNK